MHTPERRRFKRIFLSNNDGITARLKRSPDEEEHIIESKVMNLSEGGLFVTVGKEIEIRGLIKGVRLTLTEIKSPHLHVNTHDTQIEIKWYIVEQYLDHIGIGFEFIGLNDSVKEQILDFITSLALESMSN